MQTHWLALFRGINHGETDDVPMEKLETALSEKGIEGVRWQGRVGNVAFSSENTSTELEETIKKTIAAEFQVRPRVILIEKDSFLNIVQENPFAEAPSENVHVYFLRRSPVQPNFQQMERFKAADEQWVLTDLALYLSTPAEFRKSQLAVRAERLIGVRCLPRTWAEVSEIRTLFE